MRKLRFRVVTGPVAHVVSAGAGLVCSKVDSILGPLSDVVKIPRVPGREASTKRARRSCLVLLLFDHLCQMPPCLPWSPPPPSLFWHSELPAGEWLALALWQPWVQSLPSTLKTVAGWISSDTLLWFLRRLCPFWFTAPWWLLPRLRKMF